MGDLDYEYILYIDEAGDDGLARVRPIDASGASEWLIVGGVLIRRRNEGRVVDWVRNIRFNIDSRQGPALHFRALSPSKKRRVCEMVADLELIAFVVCSNKKNMRGWVNPRADRMGGKQWFYNYCVRLLMERVTKHCLDDSRTVHGSPKNVKVVFSQRGGHSYGQTKAYWEHLRHQAIGGTTYLNKWVICFDVLRYSLVDYLPHTQVAGLQLADVVASAFYQAVDTSGARQNHAYAELLQRRMGRLEGRIHDYGVILQPTPPWKAKLNPEQQRIFRLYGYCF